MMRAIFAFLGIIMLAFPVVGHELAVYTVIVNSEGPQPGDIPDGALKEGDAAWFWMKDSTENATLIIELSKGDYVHTSPVLYYECELDENGTKVNEDCENRYDFYFNQSYAAGVWDIDFKTYVDGELNKTSSGSVDIEEDHHAASDSHGEHLTAKDYALILAMISLIVIVILLAQILDEENSEEE
jgi:hypothetical protein